MGSISISSYITPSKLNGNISKFAEGVSDDARVDISECEQISEELARALDEATSCVQKLGLGWDTSSPERALASVIKGFAHGENLDRNENEQMGLSQSIYVTSQGEAEAIVAILGVKVEKAEEWHTHLIDHVSRKLTLLEGSNWEVTEERARKEVQSITGLTPTRINWSRKTLENPLPTGTLLVSFKQATRPFRLFGIS
ncbi:hypothetical protein EPUL_003286 [Erysiphe pulchra]|uniref:Uncharacterized protein n=1 Tax=Erysiphe pulchra TaxID=225359 RepID=A0A2S4PZB7_9PEZI|nr:hypothetical protein EPUL_003286 [Erysiphe pulchra]